MRNKEWAEEVIAAYKHRIEQYRYAIRKDGYTKMFAGKCSICEVHNDTCVYGIVRCPLNPRCITNARGAARKAMNKMERGRVGARWFRKKMRERLEELIQSGRETGVLERGWK